MNRVLAEALDPPREIRRLSEINYFNDQTLQNGFCALKALNLSELYGLSPELVRTYAQAGVAASAISYTSLADTYNLRAQWAAQQVQDPPAHAYSLLCAGAVNAGFGRWAQSRAALEQSMAIAIACGDQRVWEESLTNLIMVTYYQGHLEPHLTLCDQLLAAADRFGDAQVQSWAYIERGMNYLAMGLTEEAPVIFEKAVALGSHNAGRAEKILVQGLLALAYLRNGDRQQALQTAVHVGQLTARAWPTTYFSLHGYASIAELYLTVWEMDGARSGAVQSDLVRAAEHACRDLRRYARIFPIGRPYSVLWSGLRAHLLNRLNEASTTLKAGLQEATRLQMPYLQGLLHEQIARCSNERDTTSREHMRQAQILFSSINALYDLRRIELLLEQW